MTKDTLSNHSATWRHLSMIRELQQLALNPKAPKQVKVCFSEILTLSGATQKSIKQQLKIEEVLSKSFDSEEKFDEALFNAMATDLENYGVKIEKKRNMIIFLSSISDCKKYAFGFSRQAKGKDMFKQESKQEKGKTVSDVKDHRDSHMHSEYDHVCCLFKRADFSAEWKVKDCFSVVELKMSNTSSAIQWKENKNFDRLKDDPIIQEIDYVLESTWRSICRNGLGSDLLFLPVAMVAAHRKSLPAASERNRWVKASMLIPDKAGKSFHVEPNGSEDFTGEGNDSIQHAAGLYLETMLFGLQLCEKCKRNNWEPCRPSAMSGRSLFFGNIELKDAKLCGSPLFTGEKAKAEGFLHVSQGELYRVKKLAFNADLEQDNPLWLIAGGEHDYENLLVKVWSVSVHDCLQNPKNFSGTLARLVLSRSPDEYLIKELSIVLLGMFKTARGTITLMREIDGKPVCLENEPSEISEYWGEFEVLVQTVLLPLARKDIIYQDLRPGFDVTSNILRVDEDGGTKRIRLIDFESLCSLEEYSTLDERYPPMKQESNAYFFLHCQIAGIAYAWIKKVRREKFVMETAVDWVHNEGKIEDSNSEEGIKGLLKWLEDQVSSAQQPAPAPVPASSTSAATVTFTGADIKTGHKEKKRKKDGS